MIIIGHNKISSQKFFDIEDISDIKNTTPNSLIRFDFDIDILRYCYDNKIKCGVNITTLKEAILSNALFAKYIISSKQISKKVQKIAENYMFDSKILVEIKSDEEIEKIAKNGIDGVIII